MKQELFDMGRQGQTRGQGLICPVALCRVDNSVSLTPSLVTLEVKTPSTFTKLLANNDISSPAGEKNMASIYCNKYFKE